MSWLVLYVCATNAIRAQLMSRAVILNKLENNLIIVSLFSASSIMKKLTFVAILYSYTIVTISYA
jgi:hypothetical protein